MGIQKKAFVSKVLKYHDIPLSYYRLQKNKKDSLEKKANWMNILAVADDIPIMYYKFGKKPSPELSLTPSYFRSKNNSNDTRTYKFGKQAADIKPIKPLLFSGEYKKEILNQTKTNTIRIGKEVGKYHVGETYLAGSYSGENWKKRLRIVKVVKTDIKSLKRVGINNINIQRMGKKYTSGPVEVIKFVYV